MFIKKYDFIDFFPDNLSKPDPAKSLKTEETLKKEFDKANSALGERLDKLNTQLKDGQKQLQDKITGQETALSGKIKECQDKLATQEKTVTEKIGEFSRIV